MEKKSVFETLSAINCNDHVEKKNGLTYLSWAWAWQIVKQNYPNSFYTIYENKDGLNYHHDGRTAWVKTGVTIEGLEMIEDLAIMDFRNKSIPLEKVESFDTMKAIQRCLTKACARHGLGLYIYAGEDLPSCESEEKPKMSAAQILKPQPAKSNKKREAWSLYKALPQNEGVEAEKLGDTFKNFCMGICEVDVDKIGDADWDKVIDAIKAL